MIHVIDYGMGNIGSVLNALAAVGAEAKKTSDPAELVDAEAIVLPGVGAFGDGMSNLSKRGFVSALENEVLKKHKPFLGICLGLQLLASKGLEHGSFDGLGWIPGTVDRLTIPTQEPGLRIPHIGWNDVTFLKKDGIYAEQGDTQVYYFVHSYAFIPENPQVISGTCFYMDNISAVQFHPEKSHRAGLQLLKHWCSTRVRC